MLIEILIIVSIILLFKIFKLEINSNKVFKVLVIAVFIPYIYIYGLIMTDSFMVVDVDSRIESTEIELFNRDGYIAEYKDGTYIIYQENFNIEIPEEKVQISLDKELETSDIIYATIEYEGRYTYKNDYVRFLAKDFFIHHTILNDNSDDLSKETIELYSIRLNEENLIKGR